MCLNSHYLGGGESVGDADAKRRERKWFVENTMAKREIVANMRIVEHEGYVTVGKAFGNLSDQDKEEFANVLLAYFVDQDDVCMVVKFVDAELNVVASYSLAGGLQLR